jgi:glutamate--cysteine ligase
LGIFYSPERLCRISEILSGITERDVLEAKRCIQEFGADAQPYGKSWDYWKEVLDVGDTLADIPGDPKHPEVFQS